MTFIGFSVIVMLLRQTIDRKLPPFDALSAHVHREFDLIVSIGAEHVLQLQCFRPR